MSNTTMMLPFNASIGLFQKTNSACIITSPRDQAEQQLKETPRGTYILRTSVKKNTRGYALSIKSTDGDIFDHYKIITDRSGLYIESEYKYQSFQELIHQYQLLV